MHLSPQQLEALDQGEGVPVIVEGRQYVMVSPEVYDRVKRVLGGALDADTTYELIEVVMAEDDANDPGLESYQKYRSP